MNWASRAIEQLQRGESVVLRPRGRSMAGIIEDGQRVLVAPAGNEPLSKGQVVLCKVRGKEYLHLVKAVDGEWVLIGNNRGRVNGWTSRANVYGVFVRFVD